MQWRRSVTKSNGQPRKQFSTWLIPAKLRKELYLVDGSECIITTRLGAYSSEPQTYVLTSGGEIRVTKVDAKELQSYSEALPGAHIIFDLQNSASDAESRVLQNVQNEAIANGAFEPMSDEDARKRIAMLIVQRRGQPEFRTNLLKAYGNRCAITRCDCVDALEAAHIRPYKGIHTNIVSNGVLLRSDLHTLFDRQKMSINTEYKVTITDDLRSTVYKQFENQAIDLPQSESDWPQFQD